jgi:hypothetical protein
MVFQCFKDAKGLRVPIPPDQLGNDLNEGKGDIKKFLFLFGLVELLEKLIGVIEKLIRQPLEQNLVFQLGRQVFKVDHALTKELLEKIDRIPRPGLFQAMTDLDGQAIRFLFAGVFLMKLLQGEVFPQKDLRSAPEVWLLEKGDDLIFDELLPALRGGSEVAVD